MTVRTASRNRGADPGDGRGRDAAGVVARLGAAACLTLALAAPVGAAPLYDETDDAARRMAIDRAHQQMATCVAFLMIAAEVLPPEPGGQPPRQRLDQGAGALIEQMLRLRDESVTRARVEAERQWLMLAAGGGLSGYPRLHQALAEPCAALAAEPRRLLDRKLDGGNGESKPQP